MTKKKWYLALALFAATSGCAGLEDCRYESVQKLRAVSEYAKCGAPECEKFPHDYKLGYLDGFYAVSTGGPSCPPAIAPERYWKVKQVLGDCDNRRHSYYSGWQDGASRASCFPDSHYLRVFETSDCPMPRCESCEGESCGCQTCGETPGHTVHDSGMIHGQWSDSAPVILGDDPIYSSGPVSLPSPITTVQDPSVTTDDQMHQDSPQEMAAAETMAAPMSTDAAADPAQTIAPESTPPMAKPADEDAVVPAIEASEEVLSPSDLDGDLSQNDSVLAPAPEGTTEAVAIETTVGVVEPMTLSDNSGKAIATGKMLEVDAVEIDLNQTEIRSAETKPLDRNTIQALFGIDEGFDFHSTGMVAYQSEDPLTQTSDTPNTSADRQHVSGIVDLIAAPERKDSVDEGVKTEASGKAISDAATVQAVVFDPTTSSEDASK